MRRIWRGAALIVPLVLSACGEMAAPLPTPPRYFEGRAALQYSGVCQGREAKPVVIAQADAEQMTLDGIVLRRAAGQDEQYAGRADFIAPMPADGRDIVYTIAYSLRRRVDGSLAGTESVIESGGHALDCPVALVFDEGG